MRNFNTEDFSGCGQYLVRNDKEPNKFTDTGFLTTIMKKIGYCRGHGLNELPEKGNVITLIDMSDGLTSFGYFDQRKDPSRNNNPRIITSETSKFWLWVQFNGLQSLCDYLNNPDLCQQEYRFATQEEVVRVVMYQRSRWRN